MAILDVGITMVFAGSQYVLIYSPYATDVYGSRSGEFEEMGSV